MQQHVSEEQLNRYRAGSLPMRETVEIDRHVGNCAACRKHLYQPGQIQAVFQALHSSLKSVSEEPHHLTHEEKRGFIHDKSDALERELVESHVAVCSRCREELDSLARFAASINAYPDPSPTPRESLWKRTLAAVGLSGSQATMTLAGLAAAATLVIVVGAVAVLTSSKGRGPGSEVAQQSEPKPHQPNAIQRIEPASPEVSPQPTVPARASNLVTLKLSEAGVTTNTFPVLEGAGGVRFEVARDPAESQTPKRESDPNTVQRTASVRHYKEYRAMLRSVDGKVVDLGPAKADKPGKVVFAIPKAAHLAAGEYQLILSGVTEYGEVETAGTYEFRIVKR